MSFNHKTTILIILKLMDKIFFSQNLNYQRKCLKTKNEIIYINVILPHYTVSYF